MKRKQTTVTEEFDKDGKMTTRTTETVEEEDTGYIYPQYPTYPTWPSPWWADATKTAPTIPTVTYGTTCNSDEDV